MTRLHGRNPRLIALASVALIIGAALVLWGAMSLLKPHAPFIIHNSSFIIASPSTSAFAQPKAWPCPIRGDFTPVDIPVGLLCDYYEHRIEHAPPRDPSGVMQKRERFYAAPHDPFDQIPPRLSPTVADNHFAQRLEAWRVSLLRGGSIRAGGVEDLAVRSSLTSDVLIESGRAMNWLDGDSAAAAFFRGGFAKAAREFAHTAPGDPGALPLLRAIDQTKALWRVNDLPAMEGRFALAKALNAPSGVESRRAAFLHADNLARQGRFTDAADSLISVSADDVRAGDLGVLDKSDIAEMHWLLGRTLYGAGRYSQSIDYLSRVAAPGSHIHSRHAAELVVAALARTGLIAEANSRFEQYVRLYHPTGAEIAPLYSLLESKGGRQ